MSQQKVSDWGVHHWERQAGRWRAPPRVGLPETGRWCPSRYAVSLQRPVKFSINCFQLKFQSKVQLMKTFYKVIVWNLKMWPWQLLHNNIFIRVFVIYTRMQPKTDSSLLRHPNNTLRHSWTNITINLPDLKPSFVQTLILKAKLNEVFQINHITRSHQVKLILPLCHLMDPHISQNQ